MQRLSLVGFNVGEFTKQTGLFTVCFEFCQGPCLRNSDGSLSVERRSDRYEICVQGVGHFSLSVKCADLNLDLNLSYHFLFIS